MRVILDTNVLIAALISRHSPPEAIYRAWRSGRFELVTSRQQIDELRRVSRYPKLKEILPNHRIAAMINNLDRAVILDQLPDLPEGMGSADPDDDFLLSMVAASNADFLVTGDRRAGILQRGSFQRARILNPSAFCDALGLAGKQPLR
ncbi:putative toxin-antitoxin system toxin component, PIN family [Altererythrobacter xixiisoli]|uniref:Putative toxin-antitoxin system toxin component, PIN family n=1 Tax=Croceibacterium xixiisoli TaxID=1476466 RepID=A0A6I4TUV0_9SPHN|nr:putative toxin-antitoxin system toxin component, PIN family [Croceibacterium xixiisoli]MXO99592.1 putative toxin-antitoxin system toxin component, PIN family [Croceibacterium xixiisoli]